MRSKTQIRSFTLLELIIVIVVVSILATLTVRQYSYNIEFSRTAEAKIRIGTMKLLAYGYYLKNGSFDDMESSDVLADDTCTSNDFYRYSAGGVESIVDLNAARCTADGKTPNASRGYVLLLSYHADTGQSTWYCFYTDDGSGCFGLPTT